MGFTHWIMDNFWLAAVASLFTMLGVHLAIGRLLRPARKTPE